MRPQILIISRRIDKPPFFAQPTSRLKSAMDPHPTPGTGGQCLLTLSAANRRAAFRSDTDRRSEGGDRLKADPGKSVSL
jgi:hypothetical protein